MFFINVTFFGKTISQLQVSAASLLVHHNSIYKTKSYLEIGHLHYEVKLIKVLTMSKGTGQYDGPSIDNVRLWSIYLKFGNPRQGWRLPFTKRFLVIVSVLQEFRNQRNERKIKDTFSAPFQTVIVWSNRLSTEISLNGKHPSLYTRVRTLFQKQISRTFPGLFQTSD